MENNDYLLAVELQRQFNKDTDQQGSGNQSSGHPSSGIVVESLVHPKWELLDPNPDVRALFLDYNQRFFWGKLSMVEVRWSPRMTL